MALIHYQFYSEVLKKNTAMYVVVPEYPVIKNNDQLKVLYLLHGLNADYTKWVRRTPIERYAKKDNWIIIMPDGGKSYYTNCIRGDKYWDYMAKELPEIVYTLFPYVSKKREDHYVAGLSMGGYGSMKLALNYPDSFKAAASFSGALNLKKEITDYPENKDVYQNAFESWEQVKNTENDLIYQAKKIKKQGKNIPYIYVSCGKQDDIYGQNQDFIKELDVLKIPYTYKEWEGNHDWEFWDESIKQALQWFLQQS